MNKTYEQLSFKVKHDSLMNREAIQNHAVSMSETVGGFILLAVAEAIERDNSAQINHKAGDNMDGISAVADMFKWGVIIFAVISGVANLHCWLYMKNPKYYLFFLKLCHAGKILLGKCQQFTILIRITIFLAV